LQKECKENEFKMVIPNSLMILKTQKLKFGCLLHNESGLIFDHFASDPGITVRQYPSPLFIVYAILSQSNFSLILQSKLLKNFK